MMQLAITIVGTMFLMTSLVQVVSGAKFTMDYLHQTLDGTNLDDELDVKNLFNQWATRHKKVFGNDNHRQHAFTNVWDNARKVKEHRIRAREEKLEYEISLNKFSDMSFQEFKDKYLGYQSPKDFIKIGGSVAKRAAPPTAMNWTALGYVTPVKNQKDCGSCWTFATTGVLEALHYKAKNVLVSFSEQQLVDCVQANHGCNGGDVTNALDFIALIQGHSTESNYPYTALDGTCKASTVLQTKMIPTYTYLNNDNDIINALQYAPVLAACSVNDAFMLYQSGIMDPLTMCGPPADINHAILITGYGISSTGTPYWIVKNSWDTDWGELGYFRIDRGTPDACGLAQYPIQVKATFL